MTFQKNLSHEKCVLIFSTALIWNFSQPKRVPALIINLPRSSCKVHDYFSILCLTTHLIHQGHEKRKVIRDVSTFTAQHVRAALSVLHMAQKFVSRQKHNMLSLLHAACLKLLVFLFFFFKALIKFSFKILPFANVSKTWRFQFSLLRESLAYFCWSAYCYLPVWRRIIFALCTKWLRSNETAVDVNVLTCIIASIPLSPFHLTE